MDVVNYVLQNSNTELFQNYRSLTATIQDGNLTWEQLLNDQERSTAYVEEIFIRATAILLGIPIMVTSETNTRDRPFTLISCSPDESDNVSGERQVTTC